MAKDLSAYVKSKKPLDEFTTKVIRLILKIPRGKVVTYGQLAELAGRAERSRQVGFILRTVVKGEMVPWQRVVGANGRIAFPKRNKHFKLQRKLLEKEGVQFLGVKVDIDRFRWNRRAKNVRGRVQPRMFNW